MHWKKAVFLPLLIVSPLFQIFADTTRDVFAKYPNKYFIETGSLYGNGIQKAFDAGYQKIYSIELAPHYFEHCCKRFANYPNVQVVCGDSSIVLSQLLKSIDAPATFWLDGHFSNDDTARGKSNTPLLMELEHIQKHPIKTHTILINDIRYFGTSTLDFITLEDVIKKIREINPNYKISFENGYCTNDVLVAHIPPSEPIHLANENSSAVLNLVKSYLPENPVIVEAGAFDGNDTVRISQFWPLGHLHSFEPIPSLFEITTQKTQNFPNVKCYQKALSDQSGIATFYVSYYHGLLGASSSLLPPKEHLDLAPDVEFLQTIDVESITLDDWAKQNGIEKVDFLWLDMQGYELNTIKASKIAKTAKVIYTEVELVEAYKGQYLFGDLCAWMSANGFQLKAIDFDESNSWYGNAIFVSYTNYHK